ncbi:hypothetical protein DSECCO2_654240 [anaerobic digester metagenome]
MTAMFATSSTLGISTIPESAKRNVPSDPYSQSGTAIMKKADARAAPGAVLTIWTAGLRVSEEEWAAPDTTPSTSPSFAIMTAK